MTPAHDGRVFNEWNSTGDAVCVKIHLLWDRSDVQQKSTISEVDRYNRLHKEHNVSVFIYVTMSILKLEEQHGAVTLSRNDLFYYQKDNFKYNPLRSKSHIASYVIE